MIARWLARRYLRRTSAGRPVPSDLDRGLSDRPDLARRRAFLAGHILIHTHIRKTAGSTLSAGLSAIVGGTHAMDLRLDRAVPLAEMTEEDRADLHFVGAHQGYGLHTLFPGRVPLYMACVREPVARAVSLYRFMQGNSGEAEARFVEGRDFETSWRAMDDELGAARRSLQARTLIGPIDASPIDEALMWQRVEQDYVLLIPHERTGEALQKLRAAFGVAWTRIAKVNVSRTAPVTPSPELAQEIRETNALDARLHDHVSRTFDDNLARTCRTIAQGCLQRLDGPNPNGR